MAHYLDTKGCYGLFWSKVCSQVLWGFDAFKERKMTCFQASTSIAGNLLCYMESLQIAKISASVILNFIAQGCVMRPSVIWEGERWKRVNYIAGPYVCWDKDFHNVQQAAGVFHFGRMLDARNTFSATILWSLKYCMYVFGMHAEILQM